MRTGQPGDRSFRATLRACALCFLGRVGLFLRGAAMPVYSVDDMTASQAFLNWCSEAARINSVAEKRYLALFTHHYQWLDLGTALMLVALATAVIAWLLRIRSAPHDTWLRTPKRPGMFMLLGIAALLWLYVSAFVSLSIDFDRKYFPWCADSMGIPFFSLLFFAAITAPIIIVAGWLVMRSFGALPAPLAQWDRTRPMRSWIATIVFGCAISGVTWLATLSAPSSAGIAMPAYVVGCYLLASARAAVLSSRQNRTLSGRDRVIV